MGAGSGRSDRRQRASPRLIKAGLSPPRGVTTARKHL